MTSVSHKQAHLANEYVQLFGTFQYCSVQPSCVCVCGGQYMYYIRKVYAIKIDDIWFMGWRCDVTKTTDMYTFFQIQYTYR